MRPAATVVTGIVLVILGILVAALYVGVYLIADCGPACVARGERWVVVALILAGLALAAFGGWLVARGRRAART